MARLSRKAFRALREQIDWIVTGNRFFGSSSGVVIYSESPKRGPRQRKRFDIYSCVPRVTFNGIRDTSLRIGDNISGMSQFPAFLLSTEKGPVNG